MKKRITFIITTMTIAMTILAGCGSKNTEADDAVHNSQFAIHNEETEETIRNSEFVIRNEENTEVKETIEPTVTEVPEVTTAPVVEATKETEVPKATTTPVVTETPTKEEVKTEVKVTTEPESTIHNSQSEIRNEETEISKNESNDDNYELSIKNYELESTPAPVSTPAAPAAPCSHANTYWEDKHGTEESLGGGCSKMIVPYDVICNDCGATVGGGEREAGETHTPIEVSPGKTPTCTEDGYTPTYSCGCGGSGTSGGDSLPALGHSYVDMCTGGVSEDGMMAEYVSICVHCDDVANTWYE